MVPDAAPIEAGRARSDTSAHRPADRDKIAAQKARMREALPYMGLQRHEVQTLEGLIDIWQPAGGLFPEQATIATRALYGERRTRAALKSLREEHRLITWERRRYRGVQTSNLYRFTPKFWACVRAIAGATPTEKQSRLRAVSGATSRRQSVPTNGNFPDLKSISLNGGGSDPVPPSSPVTSAAAPSPADPSPSTGSSSQEGGAAELRPLLARVFADEWIKKYGDGQSGTMREEKLREAEARVAALAADACQWATARGLAHDPAAVHDELARDLVRLWLAHPGTMSEKAPRGALIERGHPFGLLHGDVHRFGEKALEAWKTSHKPKRAPLRPLAEPPPRRVFGVQSTATFKAPERFRPSSTVPATPASDASTTPTPRAASQTFEPFAKVEETSATRARRVEEERAAEARAWTEIHRRTAVDIGQTMPTATTTDLPASTYAPPKGYDPERPRFGLTGERLKAWRAFVQEEQSAAELAAWNAYDAEHVNSAPDAEGAGDTAPIPRWEELLHVARLGGDPAEHVREDVDDLEHDLAGDVDDFEPAAQAAAPADHVSAEPFAASDQPHEADELDTAAADETEQRASVQSAIVQSDTPPQQPEHERRERAAMLRAFVGSAETTDEPRPIHVTLDRLRAFVRMQEKRVESAPEQTHDDAPARFVERDDEHDFGQPADLEHDEHDPTGTNESAPNEAACESDLVPPTSPPVNAETSRKHPRTAQGGRARQGTTARERTALVAALAVIADSAPIEDRNDDNDLDGPAETSHAPPLLRDARERPGERAPQRRRRPPPERS